MTVALSADQRSSLEKLVQRARQWIVEDLEERLAGTFGIDADGRLEEGADLSLSNAQALVRADLVEVVEFLRSEGEDEPGSVARLVREAAFTHTNRLIAVRVAEAIGLLPETMAKGTASSGFRDFSELAPTIAATEWGRFAEFLRLCADELAADVPALFDPRNPLLDLAPSEPVLARVVEAIAALDDELWAAPDTLGWAYQFFNTGEERREMRESSAPRNSRELAVRNQFFTPNYVVEFLVHNGLGAHLAAGFPGLADELDLLVEVPKEEIQVDLDAVSVLDPACGSGHFLLGAYDVLEKAWQYAGVDPAESAPAIVRSLWGVDIDPRATQIAQAAVMFRARRHCRDRKLPTANVVCARSLPTGPEIDAFIGSLPAHVARAVRGIAAELVDAPVLGPLLKIEERLDREVRDIFGTGVIEGTLSEAAAGEPENIEAAVLDALSAIADSTTSTASQRLFAAEAHDAVRFVEAMARRYTAVLMNPPFGEPVPSTKTYLKVAYEWLPPTCDLLAAFVGRGLELAGRGGTCGAITGRSGLFLSTFSDWRTHLLTRNRLVAMTDLGFGIMEQAMVEAAAYIFAHEPPSGSGKFIRLLRAADRPAELSETISHVRDGQADDRFFEVELESLSALPGRPFAYWMEPSIRSLFLTLHPVEGHAGFAGKGHDTGDDLRFVRAFWEVQPERIAYTLTETLRGVRWVPCAKGGAYSPYWSEITLLVDWRDDGEGIKSHPKGYPRNTQYNFQGGITWPRRTNSGLGARIRPSGTILVDKGAGLSTTEPFLALAWLRSRLAQALVDGLVAAGEEVSSGGASRSYEIGLIQKLPWVRSPEAAQVAARMATRRAHWSMGEETSRHFVAPIASCIPTVDDFVAQLADAAELDALIAAAASLSVEGLRYLDRECSPMPTSYSRREDLDEEITRYWSMPIAKVIDEIIEAKGGVRAIARLYYFADRRTEVISHGLEVHPESIARVVKSRKLRAYGEAKDIAIRWISYFVGIAFGRWDLARGMRSVNPLTVKDLTSAPRRHSPGEFSSPDGDSLCDRPANYSVSLPPSWLLVDQPGHSYDIAAKVATASVEVDALSGPLSEVIELLGSGVNLSSYLRQSFFAAHLATYSSRPRKAPIYWQLQVPSKAWGIWLYAPKLSREMLFAIVRETEQRQRLAEQQIGHFQREAETGSGGRKTSEVAKELEAEQKLAVELASFRAEAERIANLGWEPDLDDGMVLNAAPLADLFPAWKDAAAYRKELRAGKYEWATVARFADRL